MSGFESWQRGRCEKGGTWLGGLAKKHCCQEETSAGDFLKDPILIPLDSSQSGWSDSRGVRLSQAGFPMAGSTCKKTAGQTLGQCFFIIFFSTLNFLLSKVFINPFSGTGRAERRWEQVGVRSCNLFELQMMLFIIVFTCKRWYQYIQVMVLTGLKEDEVKVVVTQKAGQAR